MTNDGREHEGARGVAGYLMKGIRSIRYIPMGMIWLYQKTVSPDHSPLMTRLVPGGVCRFHPTCSEYAYTAIERYGIVKGGAMGAWRICRCNPFNPGGFDPVP